MKKQIFTTMAIVVAAFGLSFCTESNADNKEEEAKVEFTETAPISGEAKELFDTKCMVCHKIQDNQDAMLAPPFAHIKKKYSKVTKTKEGFITAFVDFAVDPTEDKAMMFGALKQFKVMPKLGYDKTEMTKIANYVYETDFPEPNWCKK
jgi:cytochrome c5